MERQNALINKILAMTHLDKNELEAGLPEIMNSPKDVGTLELIAIRPDENQRQVLEKGEVTEEMGLVGDSWYKRKSSRTSDGSPHPEKQINIMNSRAAHLVAQSKDRWSLAGDQLYVDFDISEENLPPGSHLRVGEVILEVSAIPHNGCKKFVSRFGLEAMKFVNSDIGKQLHLRGINAKVIKGGPIQLGDKVCKSD